MFLNKDEIKEHLTPEQIFKILDNLGAEPEMKEDCIISRTICHNPSHEGSRKLYYFFNTRLFICFTCCGTFDIFDLIIKIKKQVNENWSLYNAMTYIVNYFSGFAEGLQNFSFTETEDWKIIERWENANATITNSPIELEEVNGNFLKNLPQPRILDWEFEGINYDILKKHNVRYDGSMDCIVIPHYDENNRLIGIRERALSERDLEFGKYRPFKFNGKMYNHPLGYNLYNLNNSKKSIAVMRTAIIFESEKATMTYASLFGEDNDISVAVCGSAISTYQIKLLQELGVTEIIIGFDRQFQKIGDEEWEAWVKKLTSFNIKYGNYVQISYLFDTKNLLDYKDSPIDKGRDVFLKLYNERIFL